MPRKSRMRSAYVIAVNRGLACLGVVRFDIHHVILLQVIDRRGIEVVGGTKVNAIDTPLAVLVTQHPGLSRVYHIWSGHRPGSRRRGW